MIKSRADLNLMWLTLLVLASGCAGVRTEPPDISDLPDGWSTSADPATVTDDWTAMLAQSQLAGWIVEAQQNNHALNRSALDVQIAAQRVRQLRADRLPTLSVGLSGQRVRASQTTGTITEQVSASANASLSLDLWGKLADAQRQAYLQYMSQQAQYESSRRQLVAQVIGASYDLATAQTLLALFEQRLENLSVGLDIIERGYRSGLNEALDVYLAQNTVEQERANVASQSTQRFQASTTLERLLGRYPGGQLTLDTLEPLPGTVPSAGVPSDLLTRRPDINQRWYALLAADAGLAVAHKNRFPALTLTGSASDSDNAVSRLLDGGALAFSAAASLITPVFQGGRLLALEEQARLAVAQAEQQYLDAVYAALAEVENALQAHTALNNRYAAQQRALNNAQAALSLATDQYQRGLVTYTTVLEAQRRTFDAQTGVEQLRNQIRRNRVELLLALGGTP